MSIESKVPIQDLIQSPSSERNIPLKGFGVEGLAQQPLLDGVRAGRIDDVNVCTIPLPDASGELVLRGETALVFVALFGTLPGRGIVAKGAVGRLLGKNMMPVMRQLSGALPLVDATITETTDHKGYRLGRSGTKVEEDSLGVLRVSTVADAVVANHTGPIIVLNEEGRKASAARAEAATALATDASDSLRVLAADGSRRPNDRGRHVGHPRIGGHH